MFFCLLRNSIVIICGTFCFLLFGAATAAAQVDAPAAAPPAMVLTPDGNHQVVGSTSGVAIYTWPDQKLVKRLETSFSHVHDLKFSPQVDYLLVAGGKPAESGGVEVWTWPAGRRVLQSDLHDDVVYRVAWTNDGTHFITASFDHRCLVIERTSGELRAEFLSHSRPVLALGAIDEQWAISGGVDQSLRVWNWRDGKLIREMNQSLGAILDLVVIPHSKPARELDASIPPPPSSLPVAVSIGSDRIVRLWQPTTGRMVRFVKLKAMPQQLNWNVIERRIEVRDVEENMIYFDRELAPINQKTIKE